MVTSSRQPWEADVSAFMDHERELMQSKLYEKMYNVRIPVMQRVSRTVRSVHLNARDVWSVTPRWLVGIYLNTILQPVCMVKSQAFWIISIHSRNSPYSRHRVHMVRMLAQWWLAYTIAVSEGTAFQYVVQWLNQDRRKPWDICVWTTRYTGRERLNYQFLQTFAKSLGTKIEYTSNSMSTAFGRSQINSSIHLKLMWWNMMSSYAKPFPTWSQQQHQRFGWR